MGLEELRNAIAEKASGDEKGILAEADAEAERIIADAEAQAKRMVAEAAAEARAASADEARKISSANLRARKIVSETQEALVQQAIAGLSKNLAGMRKTHKREYEKAFGLLAKQALAEMPGALIRCSASDAAIAKKFGKVGKAIECSGGLVAESQDGRVRIDNTFDSLVEERRDGLKQKAYRLLFAKGTVD